MFVQSRNLTRNMPDVPCDTSVLLYHSPFWLLLPHNLNRLLRNGHYSEEIHIHLIVDLLIIKLLQWPDEAIARIVYYDVHTPEFGDTSCKGCFDF